MGMIDNRNGFVFLSLRGFCHFLFWDTPLGWQGLASVFYLYIHEVHKWYTINKLVNGITIDYTTSFYIDMKPNTWFSPSPASVKMKIQKRLTLFIQSPEAVKGRTFDSENIHLMPTKSFG